MSPVTQAIAGLVVVIIIGFIIVGMSEQSPEEQMAQAFLRSGSMLNQYAHEKCREAVEKEVKTNIFSPTDSSSDQETFVSLTWTGVQGKFDKATCKYVKTKGIVSLVVNGKTIIAKE
jgi:hypothetical protein